MSDKIHYISAKSNTCQGHEPKEKALFTLEKMNGHVVFLDLGDLVEDSLLRLLAINGVTAVIDARLHPVFKRPKFKHRQVLDYFSSRKILYVEYAFFAFHSMDDLTQKWEKGSRAYIAIERILPLGLTICLFDQESKSIGWLDEVKYICSKCSEYSVELHPRSLRRFF